MDDWKENNCGIFNEDARWEERSGQKGFKVEEGNHRAGNRRQVLRGPILSFKAWDERSEYGSVEVRRLSLGGPWR